MNKKQYLNISHIIGFFVGVVVTVIFNWVVFKDPKKITAPGVTSVVAMCTFALALYSTLQVKLWLNNKLNDKAFKQTEKILEYIEGSNEAVNPMFQQYMNLKNAFTVYGVIDFNNDGINRLNINSQKVMTFCDNLTMSLHMLKYWGVKLEDKGKDISKYISCLREINTDMVNLRHIANQEKFTSAILLIGTKFNASFDILETILESRYDQLFSHNSKTNIKLESHTTN